MEVSHNASLMIKQSPSNGLFEQEQLPLQQTSLNGFINSNLYKSLARKNHLKNCHIKPSKYEDTASINNSYDKQNLFYDPYRTSNIQMLKKQIKYLQEDQQNEKFPREITKAKRSMGSIDLSINTIGNFKNAHLFQASFNRTTKHFVNSIKQKQFASEINAKKYYSHSKEKSRHLSLVLKSDKIQPNFQKKNYSKYQLIAPYRKYFQANRGRQNKSCTIKIDQIYGKKINQLASFAVQDL